MIFLLRFFSDYANFRICELQSAAKAERIKIQFKDTLKDEEIYLFVDFESEEDVQKVLSRCVLIKNAHQVFAEGKNYEELIESFKKNFDNFVTQNILLTFKKTYVKDEKKSYKMVFDTFNKKRKHEDEIEIMKLFYFSESDWISSIKMKNPDFEFHVLEEFEANPRQEVETKMKRLFFTRRIPGESGRGLLTKYTLKKRKYIGTTSMNETLSFLCANQALATPNSLIMDPFVGTGSILISCMHFGSHVIGTDLDVRVLRGKNDVDMWNNMEQYKISTELLDLVRSDVAQLSTWNFRYHLDSIVCDPPYGVRAGAKRVKTSSTKVISEEFKSSHIPSLEAYELGDILIDLVSFAKKSLKIGGRLIYWFPTNDNFKDSDLPTDDSFILLSNIPEQDS
eukprot:gene730-8982_t